MPAAPQVLIKMCHANADVMLTGLKILAQKLAALKMLQ